MPRREHSIYTGESLLRTRENERLCWEDAPLAKKHPKYVHGKVGMAMLLHKIAFVRMRWYDYDYNFIHRLKHPILTAHTICGTMWRLEAGKSGTCELPTPDAVICGICSGTGRIWPRGQKNPVVTKRQAKDRLGCVAKGTQV